MTLSFYVSDYLMTLSWKMFLKEKSSKQGVKYVVHTKFHSGRG